MGFDIMADFIRKYTEISGLLIWRKVA